MAVPRRLRWLPRGNVRTISATNFLAGLYQSALNVVLQPFVLGFGGGLTAVGLLQAEEVLKEIEGIKFIHFTGDDVVRHELVQDIIRAYDKYNGK